MLTRICCSVNSLHPGRVTTGNFTLELARRSAQMPFLILAGSHRNCIGGWKATLRSLCFLSLSLLALTSLPGCGAGETAVADQAGSGGGGSTGTGGGGSGGSSGGIASVTASLAWDPVPDSNVIGYIIHYGTQSPNSAGSCAYQQSIYSPSASATVSGLSPNTLYFFAVSAYNGVESTCSAEVSTVTSST